MLSPFARGIQAGVGNVVDYEKFHEGSELELGPEELREWQSGCMCHIGRKISLVCSGESEETDVAGTKACREQLIG